MPVIKVGNTSIRYEITRSKKRERVSLIVDPSEGVLVIAPEHLESRLLQEIVHSKASWILEKQARINEVVGTQNHKEYYSGEKFPYLGRMHRLKVLKNDDTEKPHIALKHGRFLVVMSRSNFEIHRQDIVKDLLKDWYIEHARERIPERVAEYAPKLNVKPAGIKIRNQRKRWGSCTKDGGLLYNWRIIMAPMPVLDYVVVHELSHLLEPNHTDAFWKYIRAVLPDYEQRKDWLRIHGLTLEF